MAGPDAAGYQKMIDTCPAGRVEPHEVATAAAYLLALGTGFVADADLLIDGGIIAALRGSLHLQLR
jgi:hypothetical protein